MRFGSLAPVVVLAALAASTVHAKPSAKPSNGKALKNASLGTAPQATQPAWCEEGVETLHTAGGDICHLGAPGVSRDGKRTLVVFLHGAIAKNVTWQWLQARALARQAKQSGFEALFPQAPLGASGFVWPGSVADQEAVEGRLIDSWRAAQKTLEARNGRPFDQVFLMGFSSGAYFVSSLALRSRGKFDGYAVFAGGAPGFGSKAGASEKRSSQAPVFVGVCAEDRQTASHSRAFGGALGALGLRHRVDEQRVGHMFADVHVAHAVSYLRGSGLRSAGEASTATDTSTNDATPAAGGSDVPASAPPAL